MRSVASSRLRHRMTLQEEIRTSDAVGGFTRTWKDVVELWAEIIPLSAREIQLAGQTEARITHRLMLRYREGVHGGQRFMHDGRIFHIVSIINPMERNEFLEIRVEEGRKL